MNKCSNGLNAMILAYYEYERCKEDKTESVKNNQIMIDINTNTPLPDEIMKLFLFIFNIWPS